MKIHITTQQATDQNKLGSDVPGKVEKMPGGPKSGHVSCTVCSCGYAPVTASWRRLTPWGLITVYGALAVCKS